MPYSFESPRDGETTLDQGVKEHVSTPRAEITPVDEAIVESSSPIVVPEVVVRRVFSYSFMFWSMVAVAAVAYVAVVGVAPVLITTYANIRLASKVRDAEAAMLGGKWEIATFYIHQAEAIEGATENLGALERVRAQVNRHNAEQYVWRPDPVKNDPGSESAKNDPAAAEYLGSEASLRILDPDTEGQTQNPGDSPKAESKS